VKEITKEEAEKNLRLFALNLAAVLDFGPVEATALAKKENISFNWQTALRSVEMILGRECSEEARKFWAGESDPDSKARFEREREWRRKNLR
jgi:hypothetical protein